MLAAQMHAAKPLISKHRHARILSWTLAALLWLARALNFDTPPSRRHVRRYAWLFDLDAIARHIARLIIIAAAATPGLRHRPAPRTLHGRSRARAGFMRSVIGTRLRRALKHRDLTARIALLIDALNRIDALACAFAKRLRRRFTKLWALVPTPEAAPALAPPPQAAPATADTS